MTIYRRKTANYRRIWEQTNNQKIPKDEQGRSYQIHHIDGNHANNDPSNLKAVTIQEHYDIHYAQGDWYACLLIAKDMEISPEEKSLLAKRSNEKRIEEKTHNFLDKESIKRNAIKRIKNGLVPFLGNGELQRAVQRKRLEEGTHNFLDRQAASLRTKKRIASGNHQFVIKIQCPHCSKIGSKVNMNRYHFDNCKQYK